MNLGNAFLAKKTVAQTLVGTGQTLVTFDTILYDADGQFASSVLTVSSAGLWVFGFSLFLTTFSATGIGIAAQLATTTPTSYGILDQRQISATGIGTGAAATGMLVLAAGATVEVIANSTSGTFTIDAASDCWFWGHKLG